MRYCIKLGGLAYNCIGFGQCTSTTVGSIVIFLPQKMRNFPIRTSNGSFQVSIADGSLIDCTLSDNQLGDNICLLDATVSSGLTGGNAVRLFTKNDINAYQLFTAEL